MIPEPAAFRNPAETMEPVFKVRDPAQVALFLYWLNLQNPRGPALPANLEGPDPGSHPALSLSHHQQALNWLARRLPASPSQPPVERPEAPDKPPPPEKTFQGTSISSLVDQVAERHQIPKTLFHRLIRLESGFDPRALSHRGAMGLGQLMPETARELGLTLDAKGAPGSVWHPESNLEASARYLQWLRGKFLDRGITGREAWRFAAGAYNAGIGNISKAMARLQGPRSMRWEAVSRELPAVTGAASRETLRYVRKLRI